MSLILFQIRLFTLELLALDRRKRVHFVPRDSNSTVMTLSFRTDRSEQTVQIQIRLLLEEQSDQGLHCLLFDLHRFDEIPSDLASLFEF